MSDHKFQLPYNADQICFFTLVASEKDMVHARLLIESLRTFGGEMSECAFWVFMLNPSLMNRFASGLGNIRFIPLEMDPEITKYYFAEKVLACAIAEELACKQDISTLVWMSTNCLVIQPPLGFNLVTSFDAALRPVHIRNVGSLASEPVDNYWEAVYQVVGLSGSNSTVESYIDQCTLLPYFNTHLFAINPCKGVLRTWLEHFRMLVSDQEFQSRLCEDEPHKIFLHQVILSALITKLLDWERIHILPPEYSYPLHFHHQISGALCPPLLDNLVCPVYEDEFRYPETLNGFHVSPALESWLIEHTPSKAGN